MAIKQSAHPIGQKLIHWYLSESPRNYPWIEESDPYKILLSEFLLQQTRSDQALPYYIAFVEAYPTLQDFASATEAEVFKLWQGLGYYSRARNLVKCIQAIVNDFDGEIPKTYKELLTLPGIGPYTAAAVSSFAFGARQAVVDGNVYRFIARLFEIEEQINTTKAHTLFEGIAAELMYAQDPAVFNQALMNIGAQICTPKRFACEICPVQTHCQSFKNQSQGLFPKKKKAIPKKDRHFHFFVVHQEAGNYIIEQRRGKDIWAQLFQFPMVETNSADPLTITQLQDALQQVFEQTLSLDNIQSNQTYKQVLTHQKIHSRFYEIELKLDGITLETSFELVNRKNLMNFAFPKTLVWYINKAINYDQ